MNHSHLRVSLVTLGDPGRLTGGYLYHRRMAAAAGRHGATVVFVSFPDRPFPVPAAHAPAVLRLALSSGPQALVLDSIAAAFLAPALLHRSLSVPLVASVHQPPGGIDHGVLRTAIQARLDRVAYRRTRRLIVASDALATGFRAEGFQDARIVVVPPGRDVAERARRPPEDLRRGRKAAFLSVGNWIERKGILELLEAFSRLPERAATLHLVGDEGVDPAYGARVRARLSRPDLAGRVVVHGAISTEEVAGLYAGADAFVLPSRKEPYGTVYGEAMAEGLPVVGWRLGNLPHLAEHGREGLVLAPGDTGALTGSLERLADDPELRRRLGHAARRRAERRPTWEESARRFFSAIRGAVAEG